MIAPPAGELVCPAWLSNQPVMLPVRMLFLVWDYTHTPYASKYLTKWTELFSTISVFYLTCMHKYLLISSSSPSTFFLCYSLLRKRDYINTLLLCLPSISCLVNHRIYKQEAVNEEAKAFSFFNVIATSSSFFPTAHITPSLTAILKLAK